MDLTSNVILNPCKISFRTRPNFVSDSDTNRIQYKVSARMLHPSRMVLVLSMQSLPAG